MGLGDLIKEVRTVRSRGAYLTPLLIEQLYERKETRLKEDMWFSPSQISHMCPRAYAIAWKLGLPVVSEFLPKGRFAMDFGTAIHTLFQDVWGPNGNWLIGGWKCTECGAEHGIDSDEKTEAISHGVEERDKVTIRSAIHRPDFCEKCGMRPRWRKGFTYIEPMLFDAALRVCGWCDGILILPGQPAELVDFKSTAAPQWIRKEPNRDHVVQLSWYLDMAKMKRGRIIYVDRTAKEPEKALIEHPFGLDQEMMREQKEMIRGLREIFKAPKEERSIPACPDGGRGPFGPCDCAELEGLWKAHGHRPGAEADRGCHPL